MFELDIRGACGLWSNVGFGANIFKAICIVNPNEICIRGGPGGEHTYLLYITVYVCVYIYTHIYTPVIEPGLRPRRGLSLGG